MDNTEFSAKLKNLYRIIFFLFISIFLSGCRTTMFSVTTEGKRSITVKTTNGTIYEKGCSLLEVGENEKISVVSSLDSGLMRVRVITNTPNYELLSADIIKNNTFGSRNEIGWDMDAGEYYVCITPERKPTGSILAEVRKRD